MAVVRGLCSWLLRKVTMWVWSLSLALKASLSHLFFPRHLPELLSQTPFPQAPTPFSGRSQF